ncbi:hypothetical protein AMAG_10587 [Allomyces macrogynus ATCC 38327]|uniref:CID domain-containing protein n=1 Tax=Allomyces macrogynus (strain ATCC 38327) TaxID=578462 RepID=A0A0L0SRC5_ALLM3|nr:hypothetical protein AMAG_10587 [Allomyces macrogynus ATCC 38327]|eukprot:KNE64920.1 hypothetical protein AMAG_10587 [Allomyces macrogynus ATCC 38327]
MFHPPTTAAPAHPAVPGLQPAAFAGLPAAPMLQQQQHQQQPDLHAARHAYLAALHALTDTALPTIRHLTMLAGDALAAGTAPAIVAALVERALAAAPAHKLPVVYLMDSVMKNIGNAYPHLLAPSLPQVFADAFIHADEPTRHRLIKVLYMWRHPQPIVPTQVLDQIDAFVRSVPKPPHVVLAESLTADLNTLISTRKAMQAVHPLDMTNLTKLGTLEQLKTLVQGGTLSAAHLEVIRSQVAHMAAELNAGQTPPPAAPPVVPAIPTLASILPPSTTTTVPAISIAFPSTATTSSLTTAIPTIAIPGLTVTTTASPIPTINIPTGFPAITVPVPTSGAPPKPVDVAKPVVDTTELDTERLDPAALALVYPTDATKCAQCGHRLRKRPGEKSAALQKRVADHMDWHFRMNRKARGAGAVMQSRLWLGTEQDWLDGTVLDTPTGPQFFSPTTTSGGTPAPDSDSDIDERVPVPADRALLTCGGCHETLETGYDPDRDEWVVRAATVREGVYYHRACWKAHAKRASGSPAGVKRARSPTEGGREGSGTPASEADAAIKKLRVQ